MLLPQVQVDNPWKEQHDIKNTQESIKKLLANGTPNWIRFPEDYRAYVKESFAAEKEVSDNQVARYKMEDQDLLIDLKARFVNIMSTKEFIRKLRINGIKCFTVYNGLPATVGLWVIVPTKQGLDAIYVSYLQVPAMIEWSILRLDRHHLPNGEDYRGWRTVLSEMIRKKVITEERAHEIFGKPTDSIVSRRYRRTLWAYRNRNVA